MILTYKLKHNRDFSIELEKAYKIANYAINNRTFSSKDVKHIGLKSIISNQILRKYGRNKKCKSIKSVNLIIPSQGIKINKDSRLIKISSLKLELNYLFRNDFDKVNQIEINNEYCYVSCSFNDKKTIITNDYIGVDLNTTGHCAVIANPKNGKIVKLGKKALHIHSKYKNIRKNCQKASKYSKLKKIKHREKRIVKDLNHKISRKIVDTAVRESVGIKLENLKNIRNTTKQRKSFRYSLNSWSFYQLRKMIEYKAKLLGILVILIDPRYTSKICSRCGLLGQRWGKIFKCKNCGHVDNADCNASFNIALKSNSKSLLCIDRDVHKGNTDIPKMAIS